MLKNQDLIKKMTLEEKAHLMSGKNFWQTKEVSRMNIRSLFLSDGPHGLRKQDITNKLLKANQSFKATCYPTASSMANSWNVELGKKLGNYLANEAIYQNVDVVLGPGTNIKRNPLCGRNFEYFSEDPYLSGKLSASYIKGIQEKNIGACLKHFACNNQEFRRMIVNSNVDERALREIYLKPFEIAIEESKPYCIMSSYNRVNNFYTNENPHLMVEILRNEFKYEGLVMTDWGGNNSRIEGLKCFNSLEMPSNYGDTDLEIITAINDGILQEEILNKNVDYLLDLNNRLNIIHNKIDFNEEKHHKFAITCAEESIVLLKNNNNVLPLRDNNVCFIGDFLFKNRYQGAGSSLVNPTKEENIIDIINEYDFNNVGCERGYTRNNKVNKTLIKKALKIAHKSEIIVYGLGLDEKSEAEGVDRKHININENQIELLKELSKLNKKIVALVYSGSVIDYDFEKYVDAILYVGLAGQGSSRAVLNILSGKTNPSGKLAETIPYHYEDVPSFNNYKQDSDEVNYLESIYVGYRYYDKNNISVRYPFGFGLSYSSFEYSSLLITKEGIKFNITNNSNIKGKEIAQLYISLDSKNVFRPIKELKGFVKVELNPHQTKEVFIKFDKHTFTFFNVKKNKWDIEEGTYQIFVCSSLDNIRLKGKIYLNGINEPIYDKEKLRMYFDGNININDEQQFYSLLGRVIIKKDLPSKSNKIVVDYNTAVNDIVYSKGKFSRVFINVLKLAKTILKIFNTQLAKDISTVLNENIPLRNFSRMSGGLINYGQLDGLIMMFNGEFVKGVKHFNIQNKLKKKYIKSLKKRNII